MGNLLSQFRVQPVLLTDVDYADVVLVEDIGLSLQRIMEDFQNARHFFQRTVPILGGESVNSKIPYPFLRKKFEHTRNAINPNPVSIQPGQAPFLGPPAVAVHNYAYVGRNFTDIQRDLAVGRSPRLHHLDLHYLRLFSSGDLVHGLGAFVGGLLQLVLRPAHLVLRCGFVPLQTP